MSDDPPFGRKGVNLVKLTRTIRLRLDPTPEQEATLLRTLETNRQALNFVSRIAFATGIRAAHVRLHHKTYRTIRKQFDLLSQAACSVIRTVANMYTELDARRNTRTQVRFH